MRTWTKLGHRAHIVPFARSQPVQSYAKEALVELSDGSGGSVARVLGCDGRRLRGVPRLRTPLLEKVGITLCLLDDESQRAFVDLDAFSFERRFDGVSCRFLWQGSDVWVIEEPLGVRFRFAGQRGELRET